MSVRRDLKNFSLADYLWAPVTRTDGGDPSFPLVSVIVPSFNQGVFLERTIRSLLHQDWSRIEIIVVDGGSTDDTVSIINRYERHIAWWVSEPDRGQADAINKGLSRATGAYVTWLASDDVLFPGALRILVRALEETPGAGIAYGGVAFIDADDRILKTSAYRDMTLDSLLYDKRSTIAQPASLISRSVLDRVGMLDETLHYCMDYDLWIRLMKVSSAVNLGDTILAGYRLHETSKTVSQYTRMAREKIGVNRRYTGDLVNPVITAHYGYIVENIFRVFRKWINRQWRASGN